MMAVVGLALWQMHRAVSLDWSRSGLVHGLAPAVLQAHLGMKPLLAWLDSEKELHHENWSTGKLLDAESLLKGSSNKVLA